MEDRSQPVVTNDSRLKKLLKNGYNITPLCILKESDAAFTINTETQSLILHKCSHRYKSFIRSIFIQDYIKEKGFPYASEIVKSTSGGSYVKYGHSFYYIEKKIEGTSASIENLQDCKKACQVLGAFHSHGAGFTYKDYPLRDNIKKLSHKIQDKRAQAYSIKSIIERKSINTNFDKSYICIIEELIKRLDLCMELSFEYEKICQETKQKPYICHNNLIKDLLKSESGELYLKSFTDCSINVPVYELSEVLKSFLSLEACNWDFDAIKELIDAYSASRPLSLIEYKILLCLLIMPDKLLSIGKKRYIKQKNWSERRYSERLDKALLLFNKQQQFIQPFAEAYGISLWIKKL